MKTTREMKLNN